MTKRNEPLEGEIVEAGKGVAKAKDITPAEVIDAIKQIVETARGIKADHDEHITKRQQMRSFEVSEVARIKAIEGRVRHYFDLVFAERREVHQGLFAQMDRALEEGNNEALHVAITGIVDLAKHSPLADAGDLNRVAAAFADPNTTYEL